MLDNYDLWYEEDRRRERWRESRPVCDACGQHIQDEYMYKTLRGNFCEECAEAYADELAEEFKRDTMEEWRSYIND